MKVLYVASECAPFVKTGGLADVIGAVPKALKPLGVDVKILLPLYRALDQLKTTAKTAMEFDDLFGGPARMLSVRRQNLNLLLLDAPHLFDRPGNIYLDESGRDWYDNHLRFGALCIAATRVALEGAGRWKPSIVHCHDWQAGLVPLLLRQSTARKKPSTVVTIHNIAFQGVFPEHCRHHFGVPDHLFTHEGSEYYGQFGFLKAGLAFADKITTVSPTYAKELMTGQFGMGLEGLLQARSKDLSGIINGIDTDVWNPEKDSQLAVNYSSDTLAKKKMNRAALAQEFALDPNGKGPLFCVISRLTEQKGLDLLLEVVPQLVKQGAQLAVLGSGDPALESGFRKAAKEHAGSVGVVVGYDENLSHRMQGGSDAILVPSRFEPCGLTQLYGLRYGTVPVVANTGGLADTVVDATNENLKGGLATGVKFSPVDADNLSSAIERACDLFAKPKSWQSMVQTGMATAVGWEQSALTYRDLYQSI